MWSGGSAAAAPPLLSRLACILSQVHCFLNRYLCCSLARNEKCRQRRVGSSHCRCHVSVVVFASSPETGTSQSRKLHSFAMRSPPPPADAVFFLARIAFICTSGVEEKRYQRRPRCVAEKVCQPLTFLMTFCVISHCLAACRTARSIMISSLPPGIAYARTCGRHRKFLHVRSTPKAPPARRRTACGVRRGLDCGEQKP